MSEKDKEEIVYTDFSNVEKVKNFLTSEEYPEGPYGAPIGKIEPVHNKSTPWKKEQRKYTPFNYEYKSLHEDVPRQYPGAHPTHDDKDASRQSPYNE